MHIKYLKKLNILLTAVLSVMTPGSHVYAIEPLDKIAVVLNDDVITSREF